MKTQPKDLDKTIKLRHGRLIGLAEYGDPKGLPIFYFHGTPGSRLEASRFHETGLSNGYRIIGIDRPGMGLSTIDKERSILSWANDVEEVANYLDIKKFSVIGHSGGAPFVAACAYSIPRRLNSAAIVSGMGPLENPGSQIGMSRGQIIANTLIKHVPFLANLMMRLTSMMLKKPNMIAKMVKQLPEVDQKIFGDPILGKALNESTLEAFRNGAHGAAQEMRLLTKIQHQMGIILKDLQNHKTKPKKKSNNQTTSPSQPSPASFSSRLLDILHEGKKIINTWFNETPSVIFSSQKSTTSKKEKMPVMPHPMETRSRKKRDLPVT